MWLGICQRDLQGLNSLGESLVRGIGAGPSGIAREKLAPAHHLELLALAWKHLCAGE